MAVSVRMDPLLERELEAAARRKGVTKSQFIVDAVERALGRKNPYELLLQVQEEVAGYQVEVRSVPGGAQASTQERVRSALEARHEARQQAWREDQAKATAPAKRGQGGDTR